MKKKSPVKGIILAGGRATRLYPVTKALSKQLLPVYDKPMIYYPLSVLMLAGIRDVLVITAPGQKNFYMDLLGDGGDYGVSISYAEQAKPRGIAESFIIAEDFIAGNPVCLILGDNIFFGDGLPRLLRQVAATPSGATIFGYYVKDPKRYGVISFDRKDRVAAITEKPSRPASHWAVTGLYFYDHTVVHIAKSLKPSSRGELEITDINRKYLRQEKLSVKLLGRGYAWLDTGTYDSLIDASMFIKTIEERQGLKVGCIEEVAYRMNLIDAQQLRRLARSIPTAYGAYLYNILKQQR